VLGIEQSVPAIEQSLMAMPKELMAMPKEAPQVPKEAPQGPHHPKAEPTSALRGTVQSATATASAVVTSAPVTQSIALTKKKVRLVLGQAMLPHRLMISHGTAAGPEADAANMSTQGWSHKSNFLAFEQQQPGTIRIAVGEAHSPHRAMINSEFMAAGGSMSVAGWTHKMEFWVYPTEQPGTIRIAVGEAHGPHRIMANHESMAADGDGSMSVAGWTHKMEFWVYPSPTPTPAVKNATAAGTCFLTMIVDRSGSMSALGDAVLSGITGYLDEVGAVDKRDGSVTDVLITTFDDKYQVTNGGKPLGLEAARNGITADDIRPRGMTALNDAIGNGLRDTRACIRALPNKPDKVVVFILTDGQENSSKTWSSAAVKKQIAKLEAAPYNYAFFFAAAGQDALKTGMTMGLKADDCITWSPDRRANAAVFQSVSEQTSRVRCGMSKAFTPQQRCATMSPMAKPQQYGRRPPPRMASTMPPPPAPATKSPASPLQRAHTCSGCKRAGHNIRTCPSSPQSSPQSRPQSKGSEQQIVHGKGSTLANRRANQPANRPANRPANQPANHSSSHAAHPSSHTAAGDHEHDTAGGGGGVGRDSAAKCASNVTADDQTFSWGNAEKAMVAASAAGGELHEVDAMWQPQIDLLAVMGFTDIPLLVPLLYKYHGSIQQVVSFLT
jgi:hypothetical protein